MGGHWEIVVCSISKRKEMDEGVELVSKYLQNLSWGCMIREFGLYSLTQDREQSLKVLICYMYL